MATIVRSFEHLDRIYLHVSFFDEDDRIELQDEDGKPLLIYTASCHIIENGNVLGDFMTLDDRWIAYMNNGEAIHFSDKARLARCEGLLDAEVEFSKRYLTRQAAARGCLIDSEGGEID